MGKSALVLGATGVVGRELVRELCVSLSRAHLGLGRWGGFKFGLDEFKFSGALRSNLACFCDGMVSQGGSQILKRERKI